VRGAERDRLDQPLRLPLYRGELLLQLPLVLGVLNGLELRQDRGDDFVHEIRREDLAADRLPDCRVNALDANLERVRADRVTLVEVGRARVEVRAALTVIVRTDVQASATLRATREARQ
jgi:hypothetical protein